MRLPAPEAKTEDIIAYMNALEDECYRDPNRAAWHRNVQRWLDRLTLTEAKRFYAEDQFDKGSMGPKIRAIIEFLEGGGKQALITNPANLGRAFRPHDCLVGCGK